MQLQFIFLPELSRSSYGLEGRVCTWATHCAMSRMAVVSLDQCDALYMR